MGNCTGIFQGQVIDCEFPLSTALDKRVLLAPLDDVLSITFSAIAGEENLITAIVMKTGGQFFEVEGVNKSIMAREELVRGTTSNGYKHMVDCSIFEVDNVTRKNLQAMATVPTIAIVIQPDDASLGNGAISVFGRQVGMDLVVMTRDISDIESGGAYVCNLATSDDQRESQITNPFESTDYATTIAAIDVLLSPAV